MVEYQQPQPQEARTWAMLCHLSTFAKYLAIPFGNIIGPLILWLLKKDQHPLVDDQGKEAMNFQITITLLYAVAFVLSFVLIGLLLLLPIALFDPGQTTLLHRDIVAPEGRIHFAGEHASLAHAWIQGAIESGLRTAHEIHAAPS